MTLVDELPGGISSRESKKGRSRVLKGFNTFFGVYLPSMLSLFGVVFFLRFGLVLGNVGLFKMIIIILFSSMITLSTALSISAIATNMQVKSGGAYYMVSRSFGVEIGSAIGMALFLAQVLGIAFAAEGFGEAVHFVIPSVSPLFLELAALSFILLLTYTSSKIALKMQLAILVILGFSFFSIFTGTAPPLSLESSTSSFISLSFWGAFALFFPAVAGIEAGFSLSGELKNPRRSLPKGSLMTVLTGIIAYIMVAVILWNKIPLDVLREDPTIFFNMAKFKEAALFGVWGATFASAIGGFIGAPRTLQALAKDSIVPKFLGIGFGANKEPRLATIFTFIIAVICVYFGNINVLAPILTMFFLVTYGMLNLAAGLESLFGNPSWRPTFSTPSFISLMGAFLCLMAMLMIDSGATVIALFIIALFYLGIKRKKLSSGWEDIRQGGLLFFCRFAIYRLATLGHSVRSWRPYFLVFSSSPTQKTGVIDFAHSITKNKGFLTVASIVTTPDLDNEKILYREQLISDFLQKRKVQSLVTLERAEDCYEGMKKIITTYGLGPITPNTIVLGHNTNGGNYNSEAEVIALAHDLFRNVVILKDDGKPSNGTIDIWWDENYKMNSELMILLAHMIKGIARWKKCEIHLKCLVQSEIGRGQRMKYFEEFFSRSRLRIEVDVLVMPAEDHVSLKTISQFSSDASLVLIGLRPPKEGTAEYGSYLSTLVTGTKSLNRIAYVLCSENIKLDKIFEYPE